MFGSKKALSFANVRELRNMFSDSNIKSWNRFVKETNEVKIGDKSNPFYVLRKCIEKFKPIKL